MSDEADTAVADRAPAPPGPDGVTLGQAVGLTFSSSWRCLLPFAAVGLAGWVASGVLGWMLGQPDPFGLRGLAWTEPAQVAWNDSVAGRATSVLAFLVFAIEAGVVVAGAGLHLSGRAVTATGMLSPLPRRLPSLVAIGLLGALAVVVPGWVARPGGSLLTNLVGLAPILLTPLYLSWSLVVPVVVQEGAGLVPALRRSAALTAGHRWKLLGLLLVASAPAGAATYASLRAVAPGDPWPTLSWSMAAIILSPPMLVAPAAAFHLLRAAKEGPAIGGLAEVFE